MEKAPFFFFILFAFIGIFNCNAAEPILAHDLHAAHSEAAEDSECCFIDCVACHPWIAPAISLMIHNLKVLNTFLPESDLPGPDSPASSIFHPPLVF